MRFARAAGVSAAALVLLVGPAGRDGLGWSRQVTAPADTSITPAMIALGDSIFHGRAAGGLCFTCHGPAARGTPGLAPNLSDDKWLHGDGSYAFIVGLVEKGVPKPKEAAAPMLPKGGANLSPTHVRAVSAYVFSLRQRK